MHVRLRAGDHHAVDPIQQMVEVEPVAEGRYQHGEDIGAGERRFEILLWSGMPGVVIELPDIGRNGDNRLHEGRLSVGQ